jgi:hypothetical protein
MGRINVMLTAAAQVCQKLGLSSTVLFVGGWVMRHVTDTLGKSRAFVDHAIVIAYS